MPEDPIVAAFAKKIADHRARRRKSKAKVTGKIRFHTSTWAVGTDEKPFNTCTVRAVEGSKLPKVDLAQVNEFDLARCNRTGDHPSWLPLLADHAPGELLVKQRGKELLIAAGSVLITINFSLEACLAQCSSSHFARLTANCVPGRNKKGKGNIMRSYLAPQDIFVPGSRAYRSKEVRHLNIMLSVESEGTVFFVADHNRLAQFQVSYRQQHWTEADLNDHDMWPEDLGPDWVTEAQAAFAQADIWRAGVLEKGTTTPIAAVLAKDRTSFNGFGRHTANDVCHKLFMHPVMPAYEVCGDDEEWKHFKMVLHEYLSDLRSPLVLKNAAATINSDWPFQFHVSGSKYFINKCMSVFRKAHVRIAAEDYETMTTLGLFDSNHIIGDAYESAVQPEVRYGTVERPVFVYRVGSSSYYTAIQARLPGHWASGILLEHGNGWRDLRLEGDTPTIGPQQFHIYNINRIHEANWTAYAQSLKQAAVAQGIDEDDIEQVPTVDDEGIDLSVEVNIVVKKAMGRPPKMRGSSGKGGRPRTLKVGRELKKDRVPLALLNAKANQALEKKAEPMDDGPIGTRTRKRKAETLAAAADSSTSQENVRPCRRARLM